AAPRSSATGRPWLRPTERASRRLSVEATVALGNSTIPERKRSSTDMPSKLAPPKKAATLTDVGLIGAGRATPSQPGHMERRRPHAATIALRYARRYAGDRLQPDQNCPHSSQPTKESPSVNRQFTEGPSHP